MYPKVEKNFIQSIDGSYIYVAVPKRTSPIPTCKDVENLIKFDDKDIAKYFNDICEGKDRITFINGLPMALMDLYCYCDYCKSDIIDPFNNDKEIDKYYYCSECHKDMCNGCYIEIDALATGTVLGYGCSNFSEIEKCKDHIFIKRVIEPRSCDRRCDICKEDFTNAKSFWSDKKNYDLCQECAGNNVNLIDKFGLARYDCEESMAKYWENTDFGSMMDWVPLYKDKEFNLILVNLNIDSKYHGRYALGCSDDHGRMGYYTLSEKWVLDEIIEALENIPENDDENLPIHRFMLSLNIPIYYG